MDNMLNSPSDTFNMRTNFKPIHHLKSKVLTFSSAFYKQTVLTGIQVQSETNTMSRKPLVHSIMAVNIKHGHNILEKLQADLGLGALSLLI